MTLAYDQHIINVLTQFYLDTVKVKTYNGRWDTYLATEHFWDEYFYLMLAKDLDLGKMLAQAKANAEKISTSPLAKAMTESEK